MRDLLDQARHDFEEQGLFAPRQPGAVTPEMRHQIGIGDHEAIEPNAHLEDGTAGHGLSHRLNLIVAIEIKLDRTAAVTLVTTSGREGFGHQHLGSPCEVRRIFRMAAAFI